MGPVQSLLTDIHLSHDNTAFRGVRRVREERGTEVLEQLEDVGADGSGRFAIELGEVFSLTAGFDALSYPVVFESSARFQWRMRDFRIRDPRLAAANYVVQLVSTAPGPVVAGIACDRYSLTRNSSVGARNGHYEVDVDPSTGFVLAWRELDASGHAIVESAYESFAYGGDVSDMTLRDRTFAVSALDLTAPLDAQSGFEVSVPDVLPGDYEFVRGEVMTIPDTFTGGASSYLPAGEWLKLYATDGVELLVFAHAAPSNPNAAPAPTGELRVVDQGSWEVGYGKIVGTTFVIAARATMGEIRQTISSAF